MPELLLKLDLSRKSQIEFFQNFLIYKNEKILYSDIDGVSYLHTQTRHRLYGVPVGTSHAYAIYIRVRGTLHTITLSSENNEETFGKFVNVISILIKPFVLVNLLLDYIKNNKLQIDELTITPEGFYKKRTWWRSPELLPWNHYYNTNINKGYFFLLKKDESKKEYSTFYSRTMSSINAPILPDLIAYLFTRNGILDEATRKQIIERKTELTTASAQDAIKNNPIVPVSQTIQEQKIETSESAFVYCGNCGNKINKDVKFCGNCGTPTSKT